MLRLNNINVTMGQGHVSKFKVMGGKVPVCLRLRFSMSADTVRITNVCIIIVLLLSMHVTRQLYFLLP